MAHLFNLVVKRLERRISEPRSGIIHRRCLLNDLFYFVQDIQDGLNSLSTIPIQLPMHENKDRRWLTGDSVLVSDSFFPTIAALSSSTKSTISLYVSLSLNAFRCAWERIRFRGSPSSAGVGLDDVGAGVVGTEEEASSVAGIPCTIVYTLGLVCQ